MTLIMKCLAVVWCGVAAVQGLELPASIQEQPPNTIAFYPIGEGYVCGNNETAYFGWLQGERTGEDSTKFFLEFMGGAVCFNAASCADGWLGAWMGITPFLEQKLGLSEQEIAILKSGSPIQFSMLQALANPGWLPFAIDHPFRGSSGIYFPTCTGDVMSGKHTLTYPKQAGGEYVAHHHGARNLGAILKAVKDTNREITKFGVWGGSGGGVTASVWMSKIAEMWNTANVSAFIDSGFHMMPGDSFFKHFYENVLWSVGPGGDNNGRLPDSALEPGWLPDWNWNEKTAIVKDLKRYNGRLRIAYLACDEDYIVLKDRDLMSKYSEFNGSTIQQFAEMWGFLTNLEKCAPKGTAHSYINQCALHHLSRDGFPAGGNIQGAATTAKQFVYNFFDNNTDAWLMDNQHFWFEKYQDFAPLEVSDCPGDEEDEEETDGSPAIGFWLGALVTLTRWF